MIRVVPAWCAWGNHSRGPACAWLARVVLKAPGRPGTCSVFGDPLCHPDTVTDPTPNLAVFPGSAPGSGAVLPNSDSPPALRSSPTSLTAIPASLGGCGKPDAAGTIAVFGKERRKAGRAQPMFQQGCLAGGVCTSPLHPRVPGSPPPCTKPFLPGRPGGPRPPPAPPRV
ncbi:hypothetical protein P7K49_003077 [Saguinus oedipus]|uniref:Uncharacterized protein n=1 Tax=Saguinus oedipus TaxID=9490 RepID=A0ABQ9WJ55_SAGOE|nr:hypothetical protein P7K49_003077 [Saguinus oedipus]